MKIRNFVLGALACSMLAACSNDPMDSDNTDKNNSGVGYIAVNILSPKVTDSRADDGGFESGSTTEDKVEKGMFLLFNADGTQYGTPQTVNLEWEGLGNYNPNVENIAKAVLVIGTEGENGSGVNKITATKILAIMNPSQDLNTALVGKKMSEVLKVVGSYSEYTTQNFVMTNSAYLENDAAGNPTGNPIHASDVAGHVSIDPEAAKLNPVEIYVERVLAKVTMNTPNDIDCAITSIDLSNGTTIESSKKLKPVITGIELANRADQANLFKSLDGWNTWNFNWKWNDPENKRSYWSDVINSEEEQSWSNRSYDDVVELNKIGSAITAYCHPNTSATHVTSVLVTAQIMEQDETGEYTKPFTFLKYGGSYYTPEGALGIIANTISNAGFRILDGDRIKEIPTTDLVWVGNKNVTSTELKGWEAVANLTNTEGKTYVNITEPEGEGYKEYTAQQINEKFTKPAYRAWMWTEGKCYYFVNIEHNGTNAEGKPLTGIIRNHVYKLTLKDLKGLGVPVFDPEEIIIPEKPSSDSFYLAARINILKWKIVSQEIHFEN